MSNAYQWFVGIDWGSEVHRVCVMDSAGAIVDQKWIKHNGDSMAEMVSWLRQISGGAGDRMAVGIETPRGALVEVLIENGFAVFSINPKQLDRFRDRHSPAGAKNDERDALVLADSLRTDMHCFHAVRLDEPALIRLREISRLQDTVENDLRRTSNRLWQQLNRYFPQLLQLCPSADEPWLWDLLEAAPLPTQAAKLSLGRLRQILGKRRIRRFSADDLKALLSSKPLALAPGAAEAASEHVLILLPQLQLWHRQQADLHKRIETLLKELAQADDTESNSHEHRDATILLSYPGLGSKVTATMLSEASQALAERDYHALRCYGGSAPITIQSGKKQVVVMRYACNERLRNALYHWAFSSISWDPPTKARYHRMRKEGHSHGRALRGIIDQHLRVLMAMLRNRTLYDPARRAA